SLSQSLSAGTLHVVGLARGLAGYVGPSRVQGVLAAGRPVVAAVEDEGETAALVRDAGCGVVVPPGDPEALAAAIRDAHGGRIDLEELGRRGRDWVVRNADRTAAVARYRALLREARCSCRLRSGRRSARSSGRTAGIRLRRPPARAARRARCARATPQ